MVVIVAILVLSANWQPEDTKTCCGEQTGSFVVFANFCGWYAATLTSLINETN